MSKENDFYGGYNDSTELKYVFSDERSPIGQTSNLNRSGNSYTNSNPLLSGNNYQSNHYNDNNNNHNNNNDIIINNNSNSDYNQPNHHSDNLQIHMEPSSLTHRRGKHTFTELEKLKMSNFESLDFPIIDNQLYREYLKKSTRLNHMLKTFGKWVICFAIGVAVGIFAYIVKQSVEYVNIFKFSASEKYISKGEKFIGFLVYYSINLLFGLLASLVIIPVGQIASGSGIPEVKGYLNGIRIPHSMNVRTLFGKVISLIFSFSSGLILGPEGPMIHIGSMIGGAVGQVKSKTLKCYPKMFWKYHNDRDRRDFISTGAAAGIAAAFGAPIGGVLFGFEEASSFWSRQLTWRTFFACLVATITTNIILQGFQMQIHDYGVLTFGFSTEYLYRYSELIGFAGLGVLGGLLGAFFVFCNVRLSRFRMEFFAKRSIYWRVLEVFVFITLTSSILFSAATFSGCRALSDASNSSDIPSDIQTAQNDTFIKFFCPDSQYNDMAGLSFNSLDAALRLLYSRSLNVFSIQTLVVFTIISFFLTTVTSGLMLASGLFIPMMLVGASLGRLVGQIGGMMFTNSTIDPSIYAMVGSSAMMAGFSRMTISLAVIVVELTEGTQYMLPVILSVMVAKWVGDIFNESIYEHLMEQKCYPFLPSQPPKSMVKLSVTDIMKSDVVTLNEVEKVSTVIQILQSNQHHGFPVIERPRTEEFDEERTYCGLILRSQLHILLYYKIFCYEQPLPKNPYLLRPKRTGENQDLGGNNSSNNNNNNNNNPAGVRPSRRWGKVTDYGHVQADGRMNYEIMSQSLARHFPSIDKMKISNEEMENMYIDLRPYMNLSSVVANETFSFSETYQLFRLLGLRHLPVVNKMNEVVGIVTRKDLL
ncbi:chloride channel protein [Tieghemostelium lacteum]|uniref:Chloride channel protein n=1 Tax=Tieghemostelium lacteum TaxID=361077 RepID=A0A152A7C5_TIELA|nr:chloride channel protein [Tieghemostelium lacteum]|eukprot:KYR02106.1 chloride channel protein [Tieghemostelium lacteum]